MRICWNKLNILLSRSNWFHKKYELIYYTTYICIYIYASVCVCVYICLCIYVNIHIYVFFCRKQNLCDDVNDIKLRLEISAAKYVAKHSSCIRNVNEKSDATYALCHCRILRQMLFPLTFITTFRKKIRTLYNNLS